MCEINPKHKAFFRLEAYTSDPFISADTFVTNVMERLLTAERELNKDGRFRFHIHEEASMPDQQDTIDSLAEELRERISHLEEIVDGIAERQSSLENRITSTSDMAYDIRSDVSENKRELQNDISDVERDVSSLKNELSNIKRGY